MLSQETSTRRIGRRLAIGLPSLLFVALVAAPAAQGAGATVNGFGNNDVGQVGIGSVSGSGCKCIPAPTPIQGLSSVTQVAAGASHAVAVLTDGTVWAWGADENGQLGDGALANRSAPVGVGGVSNAIQVAAASRHSLALLSNGTVLAWGDNSLGQLGIGNTAGPDKCGALGCSKSPLTVPGLSNVIAISAAGYYSLALLADGTVMAWGSNEGAQLGNGERSEGGCSCIDHPIPVAGLTGVAEISAGYFSAEALLADGTVRGWGNNAFGQSGNGTKSKGPEVPCGCTAPVSASGLSGVRSIEASSYSNTAVLADGSARIWGSNYAGQLGTGDFAGPEDCSGAGCSDVPVPIPGLPAVRSLSGSYYTGYALLPDGTARVWGDNEAGQFGAGATSDLVPTPVPSLIGGASEIAAGDENGFALIGPTQTLKVEFAGAGSGTVLTHEGSCPPACSGLYPQGRVAILRGSPATPGDFAGFSGACSGTGVCQAAMSSDQTVTATFGKPTGTRITKARIKARRKKATFSFEAPGALTGFQCLLARPKPKSKSRRRAGKSKSRRKRPKFVGCRNPKAYKHLKPGKYRFKVRALNILGADAKPAIKRFKIKPRRRK